MIYLLGYIAIALLVYLLLPNITNDTITYLEYRDGWIGYYWDHVGKVIYICLLPYMVIKIWLPRKGT